jgi:hypothetical protein
MLCSYDEIIVQSTPICGISSICRYEKVQRLVRPSLRGQVYGLQIVPVYMLGLAVNVVDPLKVSGAL